MAEVLLAHSYFLRLDPKEWRMGKPYPPLGTLYAAAALRAKGHEVALFDAMLETGAAAFDERLARERPRLVLLYEDSFNYLSKMCLSRMREQGLRMAHAARGAGARVLAAGSDVTDHRALYAEAGVEMVLVGEAETTACEVADALLRTRGDGRDVAGVSWMEDGKARASAPRSPEPDLDVFPQPLWDLVDMEAYRRHWMERHGCFSLNLVTSRGCPYRCNWCAKPIYSTRYNAHSPERVARDLALLRSRYGPDHVWFADDIFGLRDGWLARFADSVAGNGARTPFRCLSRADLLDEPGVAGLARAGCQELWIGAESGSQKILDAMDKGITVAQIESAAALLRRAGIRVGFFLQFGYPGEGLSDIDRTLALVRTCVPDEIGISVSYPLPGTVFYERVKAGLREKRNWEDSADLDTLYETPFDRSFYRALHGVVHRHHRLHRGLLAARAALRGRLAGTGLRRALSVPVHAALLLAGRSRLHAIAARGSGRAAQ